MSGQPIARILGGPGAVAAMADHLVSVAEAQGAPRMAHGARDDASCVLVRWIAEQVARGANVRGMEKSPLTDTR